MLVKEQQQEMREKKSHSYFTQSRYTIREGRVVVLVVVVNMIVVYNSGGGCHVGSLTHLYSVYFFKWHGPVSYIHDGKTA